MAVINVFSKEDFLEFAGILPPKAYVVVTDEVSYVWLVPVVTSNHRHYVRLELKDDTTWREVKAKLESRGFKILHGHVSFPKSSGVT